ncbi:unnamed protein product (macronuclear) [Paramecium tetraurelia]|uniref:Uncharacterized protein n=1 Tax=Paramecium tetraurelia TaxID=5888 RepID=A0CNP0_PARTE|nr:uncharacterized protein GSPATT00008849001 [Paramecium tetraurelia]CAK72407.1 unnamed protein product [Paramecium tetraurelia]|eukprot:XP_001439804.1 hypothetical protein (macronuclear) [Paramecium tetraurelia strain d4-2]
MQIYPQPQDETDRKLIEIPFNIKEQTQLNKYQSESIETTQKDQLSSQFKSKGQLSSDQKSNSQKKVRLDSTGQPILKKSKAHKITFSNELCQIYYVESWKEYNSNDIQEEEKENCCPFCTMF